MRVLYVEDAELLASAVKHNVEKQGISIDIVNNGEDGLDMALKDIYDCVILDIMLPKLSGTDILKRMREKNVQTPVIMLSALSEVETKVGHLDKGADDYLAKPFKTAELIARIRALVRRPKAVDTGMITFSDLELDKEHLLAKVWGEENVCDDNYIETYISRIRKLFTKVHSKAKIVTIRSLGYKLTDK